VRRLVPALVLLVPLSAAAAQIAWKSIGVTSSGNTVYVAPRTIKRSGSLVTATVRVVFTKAVQTPTGTWATSRTTATFDCAKRTLAAKENVFYADAKETRVADRKVNKQPGFGPALGGSLGAIALDYLCAR
jgi:uncharacterized membrane protein YdbT with pleckstrin-like domain